MISVLWFVLILVKHPDLLAGGEGASRPSTRTPPPPRPSASINTPQRKILRTPLSEDLLYVHADSKFCDPHTSLSTEVSFGFGISRFAFQVIAFRTSQFRDQLTGKCVFVYGSEFWFWNRVYISGFFVRTSTSECRFHIRKWFQYWKIIWVLE